MYRNNWDESYKRAREARLHGARHTFIEPEALMCLITVHRDFLRLRRLIEQHWEAAENEQGGGYSDRDLYLWAQALGWHD